MFIWSHMWSAVLACFPSLLFSVSSRNMWGEVLHVEWSDDRFWLLAVSRLAERVFPSCLCSQRSASIKGDNMDEKGLGRDDKSNSVLWAHRRSRATGPNIGPKLVSQFTRTQKFKPRTKRINANRTIWKPTVQKSAEVTMCRGVVCCRRRLFCSFIHTAWMCVLSGFA